MITFIKYVCLFFYEQIKEAFLEVVRINETVAISDSVTEDDIKHMLTAANIHGAFTILSTAMTTITLVYLFIYGFYDEIVVEIDGVENNVRKFREKAIILIVVSIVVDILSKVF